METFLIGQRRFRTPQCRRCATERAHNGCTGSPDLRATTSVASTPHGTALEHDIEIGKRESVREVSASINATFSRQPRLWEQCEREVAERSTQPGARPCFGADGRQRDAGGSFLQVEKLRSPLDERRTVAEAGLHVWAATSTTPTASRQTPLDRRLCLQLSLAPFFLSLRLSANTSSRPVGVCRLCRTAGQTSMTLMCRSDATGRRAPSELCGWSIAPRTRRLNATRMTSSLRLGCESSGRQWRHSILFADASRGTQRCRCRLPASTSWRHLTATRRGGRRYQVFAIQGS